MNTTHDTVTVPAGTADDWQPEGYRVIYGTKRAVPGREDVTVMTTAIQLRSGTIDDGTVIEGPQVYLDAPDRGMTAAQARSLAGLLRDAADTLDRWTGTSDCSPSSVPVEQPDADALRNARADIAAYRMAAASLLYTSRDDITTQDDALARVDKMVNPTS